MAPLQLTTGVSHVYASPNSQRLDESLILGSHSQSGVSSGDSVSSQLPVIPSQDETPEESTTNPAEMIQPVRQESVSSNGVANGSDSRGASFEEPTDVKKVAVSVHNERTLLPSYSLRSNDFIEVLQGKQDATKTAEAVHGGIMSKSTSGDTQASLGVLSSTVPSADPAAAILGASTSSLSSIAASAAYRQPPLRHRRFGCIEENDLSMPYNHYRCLSPNEHHGKSVGSRMLRRQFSLDRPDEPVSIIPEQSQPQRSTPRLYKQNSAGAANDLERIEEVPSTTPKHFHQNYRHAASVSLSVESLSLR